MTRRITFHSHTSWEKHGYSMQAIKEWREREHYAERPSALEDFYRAHGLCVECRSAGQKLVGLRWKNANGSEESSSLGTDATPIGIAELVQLHRDAVEYGLTCTKRAMFVAAMAKPKHYRWS
jgi:hypothetical protein